MIFINLFRQVKYDFVRVYAKYALILVFFLPLVYLRTKYVSEQYQEAPFETGFVDGVVTLFSVFITPMVLAPLFIALILEIVSFDANDLLVIRYRNRSRIWGQKIKKVVIHCILFTAFLIFLELIAGGFILGTEKTLGMENGILHFIAEEQKASQNNLLSLQNLEKYSYLYHPFSSIFLIALFVVLGLTALAILVQIVTLITKSKTIGYISMIVIITTDTFIDGYSLLSMQMTLEYQEWLSIDSLLRDFCYLLLLTLVLYASGGFIYKRTDLLFKENEHYEGESSY